MRLRLLCVLLSVLLCSAAFAHPGGTDANGGHFDRETGEYHYHHGHPPHQHPNGICPYSVEAETPLPDKSVSSGSNKAKSRSSSGTHTASLYRHSSGAAAKESSLSAGDIAGIVIMALFGLYGLTFEFPVIPFIFSRLFKRFRKKKK